jgi:two-component system, OmpR family, alkaline phosphatase synthesis response regulator PhoP
MATARDLVLVVDDDPKIVALVRAYLISGGFDVLTAADGANAVRLVQERKPRLVVLDLMLPVMDGIEVTREVRRWSDVPILMLTARGSVQDRIGGFGEGADDYLVKPFAPSELLARVRAILRRTPVEGNGRHLRHADLDIDLDRHEVRQDGHLVELSALEFRLLAALVRADGHVLSRDRLLDVLSGQDAEGVLERSVDVYIGRLRSKLGDDPDRPRYVATVRGAGYRTTRDQ